MIDFLGLLACALTGLFRSRARLEAEILVLRHQLNVLRRKAPKRVAFNSIDRWVFAGLWPVTSLAVMQQFGSDRGESGHRADIVDRSKMTHNVA
jgi:hypothetical protein